MVLGFALFAIAPFFTGMASAAPLTCEFTLDCTGTELLKAKNDTGGFNNAHVAIPNSTNDYNYSLCCETDESRNLTNVCSTNTTTIVRASNENNSHIQTPEFTNYNQDICMGSTFGEISCEYVNGNCTGETVIGESGSLQVANFSFTYVTFENRYEQKPIVIATPASQNAAAHEEDNSFIPVVKDVSAQGFNISLCRDNATTTCDSTTDLESVHWVAINEQRLDDYDWIAAGTTTGLAGDGSDTAMSFGKTLSANPYVFATPQTYNQSDLAMAVWVDDITTSGANAIGCVHEGTTDSCTGSDGDETLGWLAIVPQDQQITNYQNGSESISNSEWTSVSFNPTYTDPIVMVLQNDDAGAQDTQYSMARNITSTGMEIRYCEQDGNNTCDGHAAENVAWGAFEQGDITVTGTSTGHCSNQCDTIFSMASSGSDDATNAHIGNASFYELNVCCTISSTPPLAPTLIYPTDGNNTVFERNVTLNWTEAFEPDGDSVNYNLSLNVSAGTCTVEHEETALSTTSFTTDELCTDQVYTWSVQACDVDGCSPWAESFNFTIASTLGIQFNQNVSTFANLLPLETNDTEAGPGQPMNIENTGNIDSDVELNASSTLFNNAALGTEYFQFKGAENETGAYAGAQTTYANMSAAMTTVFTSLNYIDAKDDGLIHYRVTVPADEPTGTRSTTINVRVIAS